ncbi:hypothetical protein O7606_04245 [Micromonospora sp. WMMD882]|uniref:hypothetical protein n=1 Tax=Micromonospora sp. WMMD882 TaxID=3015151 RepID=UPI00248CF703|nr:hypothetical protein [Micromonospora sp. WMMD882]WBB80608.1 hypothetical protein O7606_04245 [Micromonospora sp. WMMD882]
MSRKRVIIGQSEWGVDERDVDTVVEQIKTALAEGAVAELVLLDGAGRPVTVYLNGRAAVTVVVDLDRDPRPSEIS